MELAVSELQLNVGPCIPRAVHPICPYPHSASLVMSWGLMHTQGCSSHLPIPTLRLFCYELGLLLLGALEPFSL